VIDSFASRIGYSFSRKALLEKALTHPSFGTENYQRLEFLGDRVLGLVVADMLFARFPEAAEGELSRRFTMLVREPTLAEIGREWRLEDVARLGAGEVLKQAILADMVEAVLGAIYEDNGLEAVRGVVQTAWKPYLDLKDEKDPKSRLQELVQGGGNPLPEYVVIAEEGPDHNKNFTVEVRSALGVGTGQGVSKQVAGAAAAAALLAQLDK
jgi:ribonuclease III